MSSFFTDPYLGFGGRTSESSRNSAHSPTPFDQNPQYAQTQPTSETLVDLLSPSFDSNQSHSFGPELTLSPGFEYPTPNHALPSAEEAAQHQQTFSTLPLSDGDGSFYLGQSLTDGHDLPRRMSEFYWNPQNASLHHQPAPQPIYSNHEESFAPVNSPLPELGSSLHFQGTMQSIGQFSNLSSQSWDLLQSFVSLPNPSETESFIMLPDGERRLSDHSKVYERSNHSQSAIRAFPKMDVPDPSLRRKRPSITALNTGSHHIMPRSVGSEIVSSEPRSSAKRRRGKLSPVRKAKTKAQRKNGNCVRCRMMKAECDGGNPCSRCKKVIGKARTYFEPCYREDLGNVVLVRRGNSEFDQETMAFRDYSWKSINVKAKVLRLSWWLPINSSVKLPQLTIECQEYAKRTSDVSDAIWQHKGRLRRECLPCYACSDTDKLLDDVSNFFANGRKAIDKDVVQQTSSGLECITLQEAYRFASKYDSSLVRVALRLRSNTILSSGSGTLEGTETLGIQRIDGAAAGYVGNRPLPPAIDHQIDVAIWEIIRKDHDHLIKQLKKVLFFKSGQRPWFEIFLTFFVALLNVQYVHGQAVGWMKSQLETDSAVRVSYIVKKMIAHWNYSADNVLHHFRAIFRGELPLLVAERDMDELVRRENLDPESAAYVSRVLRIIKDQDGSFLKPRTVPQPETPEITELGDHWIQRLFADQYIVSQQS